MLQILGLSETVLSANIPNYSIILVVSVCSCFDICSMMSEVLASFIVKKKLLFVVSTSIPRVIPLLQLW